MNERRRTAVTVGILFIVATAFYMAGQAIYGPILGSADYLDLAYPGRTRVLTGVLLELVGVLAIPLIAVFFSPVLRVRSEALALGYVAFRLLEATALVLVDVNVLSLMGVSREYLAASPSDAAFWEGVGSSILEQSESAFLISVAIVFPLGALMLNSMLWRARLVPRIISGWGLLAAGLLLSGSILDLFGVLAGVSETGLEIVLAGPIALQEMVLAVWLIWRGLDVSALASDTSVSRNASVG